MLKGFRDFVLRGNVVDLAIAVIIGAAFTQIVNSLVKNIINPLIAAIVHKPDFSGIYFMFHGGKFTVGDFLNDVISFLLISATVYFFFVLPINAMLRRFNPPKAAPPTMRACPECLADIPIAAKRCSHCTQPVEPAKIPA